MELVNDSGISKIVAQITFKLRTTALKAVGSSPSKDGSRAI